MTFATFPVCFRSVRDYLNQINQRNQRTADGLQIRVHQFESDTCLQYLAAIPGAALNKTLNIHRSFPVRSSGCAA